MFKFIAKVLIAGEIHDRRRVWKRNRRIKKQKEKEMINRLNDQLRAKLEREGKETKYSLCMIGMIISALSFMLWGFMTPLAALIPLITFFYFLIRIILLTVR